MSSQPQRQSLENELREKFVEVLKHADALGISAEQLNTLDAVADLRAHIKLRSESNRGLFYRCRSCFIATLCISVFTITSFILLAFILEWPISRNELVAYTFSFERDDLSLAQCLLDVETPLQTLARPPVDCRICRGIKNVDKVAQITSESFEMKYAYSGRPVIITDAMINWTATQTFSFDFFRRIYSVNSPVLAQLGNPNNCQFFPYRTNFTKLSEVFEMDENRASMSNGSEPWYIGWSNCDPAAANILRAHYRRPYFLPGSAEGSRTDWIFMGTPGYGAHMHIDNVNNPSWQAQVTGVKRWILEPPPECYLECAERLEFVVNRGEIIVLDTNQWFHATEIIGSEMSITIGSEYD